jgi:hypothetical protein
MPSTLVILIIVMLCLMTTNVMSQSSRFVGIVNVKNVGLLNVFQHTDNTNVRQKHSILCSTYDSARGSYDPVVVLQYPGEAMLNNFTDYEGKSMYTFFLWPKEVRQIPRKVFGFDAISTLDGSTIVGKTNGAIYATDVRNWQFPATTDIGSTVIPSAWMYSSLLWKFIDRDRNEDILTCRVQIEAGLVKFAQLVWLEHPRNGIEGRNWKISVLKDSACDTNIAETEIKLGFADTYEVVFATGVYTKRLTFFYTTGLLNNWDNPNSVAAAIIESGREYYDISTVDINNDGKVDILVTVQAQNEGSVEVFEYPEDFRNSQSYVRHVLYDQFRSRNGGTAGRTPGVARTFFPTTNKQRKPWIMVAGADDGRAYYLRPTSENANNWNYELVTVLDAGTSQIVSGMTSADIDGDGYEELLVSVHNRDRVEVYSFRP